VTDRALLQNTEPAMWQQVSLVNNPLVHHAAQSCKAGVIRSFDQGLPLQRPRSVCMQQHASKLSCSMIHQSMTRKKQHRLAAQDSICQHNDAP